VSVERGTAAQLVRRREQLAQGAEHIGWKIGFNLPAIQERLGIDAPVTGFLTTDAVLDDGATWSLGDGEVLVESEIAVEIGEDAHSIAALLPALELVDPPDLEIELEQILAGNVFHRAVVFGPRVETDRPGAVRVLVNGEEQHAIDAERAGAALETMVAATSARLEAVDERLVPGDRIITGILCPPHAAETGDRVRLEVEGVGAVELAVAA
jgi:2-keto-4-pentenoate hydratase